MDLSNCITDDKKHATVIKYGDEIRLFMSLMVFLIFLRLIIIQEYPNMQIRKYAYLTME